MKKIVILTLIGMMLTGCLYNQPQPKKSTEKKGLTMDLNQNHKNSGNVEATKIEFSVIK